MDQNLNPYNNFQQGQNNQNVPPPPPPQEAQIGVRTMESDLESIKQSGGEMPQSQIINAPQLSQEVPPTGTTFGAQASSFGPSTQAQVSDQNQQSSQAPSESAPTPSQEPSKFNFKIVFIILGGLILAGIIGYGVYYLTSSLKKTPQVSLPQPEETSQLPVATTSQENTQEATSLPATESESALQPEVAPLVHKSLISNPNKKETLILADNSLKSFEEAIASSSKEKLIVGSVKDLEFVDPNNQPIESSLIISAYFPSQAFSLSSLFERDFTSWLYYDKNGGAKLGMIFQLKQSVDLNQASSTVKAALESIASEISNFFVSNSPAPANTEFKDGMVEQVPVRFLVYSPKNSEAFEYGWYKVGESNYLVIATSYNQMVDIIKRLKTAFANIPTGSLPSGANLSTSTESQTSTTSTTN